jgi:hypothetical protein
MKIEFSRHIFEIYSNIKFRENPSSESRVVRCRRTDRYEEAIVAFHNFEKAAKNVIIFQIYSIIFPLLDDIYIYIYLYMLVRRVDECRWHVVGKHDRNTYCRYGANLSVHQEQTNNKLGWKVVWKWHYLFGRWSNSVESRNLSDSRLAVIQHEACSWNIITNCIKLGKENYIMRSLMICIPYPILCGW